MNSGKSIGFGALMNETLGKILFLPLNGYVTFDELFILSEPNSSVVKQGSV